ncbi:hypothetical protein E2I00_015019, partial [Balaenoptera physalus]
GKVNRGRGPAGLGAGVNPGTRPDLGGAHWEPLMASLLCLVSQLPENSNPLSLSLAWKREEGTEGRVPLKSFQTLFPGMLYGRALETLGKFGAWEGGHRFFSAPWDVSVQGCFSQRP